MITVFGATGNVGSVVAARLLKQGQTVRVVSRMPERLAPLVALGAEPMLIDSVLDREGIGRAIDGADAAYTMVPPTGSRIPYDVAGQLLAAAAGKAGVSHLVNLSALGVHRPDVGGHVAEYDDLESAINGVSGLNVLHLRPGLFMTSFYSWIGPIIEEGEVGGLLRGDFPVPRVSFRDIGAVASDALLRRNFEGINTQELHGQRDLSMNDAARIIGGAIQMPSLRYVQRSPEEWLRTLMGRGMDIASAQRMNEMYIGWNAGVLGGAELRGPRNTNPTTFEEFVTEDFLPRFRRVANRHKVGADRD